MGNTEINNKNKEALEAPDGYYQLGCYVVLQAMWDYFFLYRHTRPEFRRRKQEEILKCLDGQWLNLLSDGYARIAKEKILKNPDEVMRRVGICMDFGDEEENIQENLKNSIDISE